MTSQLSNEGVEQGRCLDSLLRPVPQRLRNSLKKAFSRKRNERLGELSETQVFLLGAAGDQPLCR